MGLYAAHSCGGLVAISMFAALLEEQCRADSESSRS